MNQNSVEIKIHEFSTGIIPSENSTTGDWISMGFTEGYMNSTLDPIPFNVVRAIANKLFAVVEGFTTDSPAIIGRVVPGRQDSPNHNPDGQKDWSVVAIISRGKDDKGRPLTVHRYFLSEGKHQLSAIVAFIENHRKLHGVFPVFDPMEKKSVGAYMIPPEDYSPPAMNQELDLNGEGNLPAVICTSNFDLLTTNIRATIKANQVKQLVSWAFQVEALETPQLFVYINTNNPNAYKRITKTLADFPSIVERASIPVDFDEKMVKGAIKKLISNRTVKEDAVKVIVDAVNNDKITDQQWWQWFRDEGLERAIQDKIFSDSKIRLLTLAAIIIPDFMFNTRYQQNILLELVQWFENKNNQPYRKIYSSFQFNFIQEINNNDQTKKIENKIHKVLFMFLDMVYGQGVPPEIIAQLIAENLSGHIKNNGRSLKEQLIREVENDLEIIHQLKSSSQSSSKNQLNEIISPQSIWRQIINNWNFLPSRSTINYQYIAELFELIEYYKLAAYFYQISQGIVSHEISIKVEKEPELYGVAITYELNTQEKFSQAIDKTKSWLKSRLTILNERKIKNAIKELIFNRRTIKEDAVKVIINAVNKEEVTEKQWLQLFQVFKDKRLEKGARNQKNSHTMVKFLVLTTIILPNSKLDGQFTSLENLWQYLNDKNKNYQDTFSSFISVFINSIDKKPKEQKIQSNINIILGQCLDWVYNNELEPKCIAELLAPTQQNTPTQQKTSSLITHLIDGVSNDLREIPKIYHNSNINPKFNYPQKLWQEILDNWDSLRTQRTSQYKIPQYQYLAEFFELLGYYQLAAYFYQISQGIVSHAIFIKFKRITHLYRLPIQYDLNPKEESPPAVNRDSQPTVSSKSLCNSRFGNFGNVLDKLTPRSLGRKMQVLIVFTVMCLSVSPLIAYINKIDTGSQQKPCKEEECLVKNIKAMFGLVISVKKKLAEQEKFSENFQENEINKQTILALKKMLFGQDKNKYHYTGVIDTKGNSPPKDVNVKQKQKFWDDKIKSWIVSKGLPKNCLIISGKDSCIQKFENELINKSEANLDDLLEIKYVEKQLSTEIEEKRLTNAKSKFETQTCKSIQQIINNSSTIKNQLKQVLGGNLPDIPKECKNVTEMTKLKWIQAILIYQKNKITNPDGIITPNGKTFNNLLQNMKRLKP